MHRNTFIKMVGHLAHDGDLGGVAGAFAGLVVKIPEATLTIEDECATIYVSNDDCQGIDRVVNLNSQTEVEAALVRLINISEQVAELH